MASPFSWLLLHVLVSSTFAFRLEQPKVLLVSFDGFRWDYIFRVLMPNFEVVKQKGVYVEQVSNIFVTKTYPNHYTLVTGLYAENHGIVANEMYDPELNKTFSMNRMDIYDTVWWEEGYPIWITNQKKGHRTGAAMWPGTDVKIHGVFPSHYMLYNESVSFEHRVNRLIEWLTSTEPINLGLLYWEQPDDKGHLFGPEDPRMNQVIADIDKKLGYLIDQLKKARLWEKVNLIVTSDHGMSQQSRDRVIELDQYVDRDLYTLVDHNPIIAILPKEGKFDTVYQSLVSAHPKMTVYKKEEIPEKFHYKHNSRIQPILIVPENGWSVLQNKSEDFLLGNHGYDNSLPDMHPLFIAHGPAFKKNFSRKSMNSVDLYPLMCHILGISPMPSNGSLGNVQELLAGPAVRRVKSLTEEEDSYSWLVGVFIGSALVLVFLLIFVRHVTRNQMTTVQLQQGEIGEPLLQS
ncbi:ectonucleotide pyrophosphatase/phosphodiesterase family member 5 [Latimeria chalumnae]|uniref:Ectonucleotide pyrophosphatase/phosphodiesterase family member 5 n=1 Tax=Latimeria chalumnae TaxID=7897 RepID=H3B5S4_LATCH|nr:PREDICTED: ectonucleotide pyrophosphatase/phosphodiesterase family member 5 [Latimeria chalumnae]XP_005998878.1 PREDICTED: ectonucleotide pyrophosphatase/phosphodiesterase family member 5 [Latimeria chalumnae]XP_014345603.1 PREDICTED: ectonucleotide pyrophosphatase/phosphodiesterase family member 5 [Latimeria chalumnae]XP_014345606.1 PREDICTED: ectonucleotide pyrophosphatase/phosphodiesterase family member 5 [Latimeria chalumnae]XP_014345607.1 PREDICTED: ectonucleotide pyrophosphatase/phosph|eukprot:XP_005998877.1 PREDICTED: ectonucleotide pyrophosphatase/phosphodiesterase family member 5 [Latimeria chalumnae]